ncbi:MAG: LysR family transcriptional regulator [Nocardia sp.]|nr:LysR family transcriptional regulator [Nocardia sp.]
MDFDIRHLRAITALADQGSHTAAARALHISQPTLTRTVRQLETITGVPLVQAGSAELTATGRDVVERGRRILAELEALRREITSHRTVRLGFAWLLPERWFRRMRLAMDEHGITTTISRYDDPMAALVAADVDVSLHRNPITAPPGGITTATIGTERRVLAVSEYDRAFPDDAPIRWEELPLRPVVVNVVSGSTTADSLPGNGHDRAIVECRNFDEWLEMVAAGAGIGIVPEICATRIQHSHVRYLELRGAPDSHVRLAWRSAPAPSRTTRHFLNEALTGRPTPL